MLILLKTLFIVAVEMMDNRYRNKYGSNGMYPLTKIKAEMISDNEADNMFENSSNEMSQSEFN